MVINIECVLLIRTNRDNIADVAHYLHLFTAIIKSIARGVYEYLFG